VSTRAGTWVDAAVAAPPQDGSSYLLIARVDDPGEKRWPVVGHWDSIEGWLASAGEFGVKLLDISHWMAIPEVPISERYMRRGFRVGMSADSPFATARTASRGSSRAGASASS
jgi:hypothetical protein